MPAGLPITLKPRERAQRPRRRRSSRGCSDKVADIPGMTVYFQAAQDIQISTRASRAQYQYTLVGTDRARGRRMGATSWRSALRGDPALREVASEAQEGGPRVDVQRRPRAGRPARRLDAERHRHALRRLRPAADFDDLRPGQPVSRHPGGAAALPAGPDLRCRRSTSPARTTSTGTAATVANTATGTTNTNTTRDAQHASPASNQVPLAAFARFVQHHRAAGDRAPGAVSRR